MEELLRIWLMITEAYFLELNVLGVAINVACDFKFCTGKSFDQLNNLFHLIIVSGVNSKSYCVEGVGAIGTWMSGRIGDNGIVLCIIQPEAEDSKLLVQRIVQSSSLH
ncbi:hypothetical protein V6N13_110226 [Hibiscus sabdariffa]